MPRWEERRGEVNAESQNGKRKRASWERVIRTVVTEEGYDRKKGEAGGAGGKVGA